MVRFANSDDRNKDVAVLRCLGASAMFTFVTFIMLLLIPANPCALTILMILLGTLLILLTQPAITSFLLIAPLAGIFEWQHMPIFFVGPFLAVIIWQTTLLLRKCCIQSSGAASTSTVLEAFHRSMFVLSLVLMLLSVALLYKGSKTWPSETSSTLAGASYLLFAHATWVATKGIESPAKVSSSNQSAVNVNDAGSRSVISGDQSSAGFSSNDLTIDQSSVWSFPWITVFYPIVYSVLLVLAPESSTQVYARLLVVFLMLGCHPLLFQRILLAPTRFHAQPDASVVVETIGETYVYDKAIRVFLEPAGVPPKSSQLCHVYCSDLGVPRMVVEVTGGIILYFTPKYPDEFVNALTRAINDSIVERDNNSPLIAEEEILSCGIEL